jgi:hypothetical protein
MNKPKRPTKTMVITREVKKKEGDPSMGLSDFVKWVKKSVPVKYRDIALVDVIQDYRSEWPEDGADAYLYISWQETVPNPDYDKQMNQYAKKLVKWEEADK